MAGSDGRCQRALEQGVFGPVSMSRERPLGME